MRIKLRGKYFDLKSANIREKGTIGFCNSPEDPYKQIIISKQLDDPEERLTIVIHELLHGCHWDLDETVVEETAQDIAKVLYKLGAEIRLPK